MHILHTHTHTRIEMYLKLQIAKKPLWGGATRIRGSHFEKQYTYYGILPAREIASCSRSLFSNSSVWRRWFKSLFNTVRRIFALHMLCVHRGWCRKAYVCVSVLNAATVSLHLAAVWCVYEFLWMLAEDVTSVRRCRLPPPCWGKLFGFYYSGGETWHTGSLPILHYHTTSSSFVVQSFLTSHVSVKVFSFI